MQLGSIIGFGKVLSILFSKWDNSLLMCMILLCPLTCEKDPSVGLHLFVLSLNEKVNPRSTIATTWCHPLFECRAFFHLSAHLWPPLTDLHRNCKHCTTNLINGFTKHVNALYFSVHILLQWLTAWSKTCLASAMACLNVKLSVHPLPTWKLTPMTSKPSSSARSSSFSTVSSLAPNFELSLSSDLESSTAMRSTSLESDSKDLHFSML